MSHVPTVLKSDRSVFDKMLPVDDNVPPSESKFFPLREVSISKRDTIEEDHCLIQKPPFDLHNFFGVLAAPLTRYNLQQAI